MRAQELFEVLSLYMELIQGEYEGTKDGGYKVTTERYETYFENLHDLCKDAVKAMREFKKEAIAENNTVLLAKLNKINIDKHIDALYREEMEEIQTQLFEAVMWIVEHAHEDDLIPALKRIGLNELEIALYTA